MKALLHGPNTLRVKNRGFACCGGIDIEINKVECMWFGLRSKAFEFGPQGVLPEHCLSLKYENHIYHFALPPPKIGAPDLRRRQMEDLVLTISFKSASCKNRMP